MTNLQQRLFELQDEKYRDFTSKLIPTVEKENIIGVRSPKLRELCRELKGTKAAEEHISTLPHTYIEEYTLHAFLISEIKDFDTAVKKAEELLPYIDNWAVCDSLKVRVFAKQPQNLLPYIEKWLSSDKTYTVRYGIGCLMSYFLGELFDENQLHTVSLIQSDEYYINMMIAWYFATALAKQYSATVKYLENGKLGDWVHNKTIQKAVESYRITDGQKAYLKTLKRKNNKIRKQ